MRMINASARREKVAPPRFVATEDHLADVLFGSELGAKFIADNFREEGDGSA